MAQAPLTPSHLHIFQEVPFIPKPGKADETPAPPNAHVEEEILLLRAKNTELLPFILLVSMETIKLSYAVTYCNIT